MANSPHPSDRLGTPVPNGIRGRVDAGVDWSNIRGNIVAVGQGIITTIYPHLSGFATTVIEKLSGGQYVYYGLETGGGTPVVHEGQQVQAGDPIAPGLGSGGIEVGYWDPASGRAVGHYTEGGGPTPEGTQFSKDITGRSRPGGGLVGSGSSGGGGASGGSGVDTLFTNYLQLRDTPRTAPPGTKNPVQWFLASFTGNWQKLGAGGGAATSGDTGAAPPSTPFKAGKALGIFTATAYGPPWGGIEGEGTTATGIDLHKAPHDYIVAVDPSVIPLHSKLQISPNPFGDPNIVFRAEDTGGAIKGNRIDFYDWRGRQAQNGWGVRRVSIRGGN